MDNQLDEVMAAILDGKYSWACVLWLEAKGYNPKDYIPCRTYNRLKKQQKQHGNASFAQNHGPNIRDLSYLDDEHNNNHSIRGGYRAARSAYTSFLSRYMHP